MSKLVRDVGPGDHVVGPDDALVTLVEYGDYECPFCGRAHHAVQEVLRRVGPNARFAFRHFPLTQMHPHALEAAEAAEAAGAQGMFWPMHDMLFENQDALDRESLLGYAEALGLDTERFARDLAADAHIDKVRNDFHTGVRSGVNGTPTFFVDGVRHDGSWDAGTLVVTLRNAIDSKRYRRTG
jgi:protein-disulfide isomerase